MQMQSSDQLAKLLLLDQKPGEVTGDGETDGEVTQPGTADGAPGTEPGEHQLGTEPGEEPGTEPGEHQPGMEPGAELGQQLQDGAQPEHGLEHQEEYLKVNGPDGTAPGTEPGEHQLGEHQLGEPTGPDGDQRPLESEKYLSEDGLILTGEELNGEHQDGEEIGPHLLGVQLLLGMHGKDLLGDGKHQ